jgi:hypothetical protein
MTVLAHTGLEDGRRYMVLEETSAFCTLGLRFWDVVTDDQVRGGLAARAWPLPACRPVVRAFRTGNGVYGFHGLPGLLDVERPSPAAAGSPPAARPFVVEVRDAGGRFLPVAFPVDLPLAERGLYVTPLPGSPAASPAGFYLFSSVARPRRPGAAVIRGELVDLVTGHGASWALVRVSVVGQGDRWGLADQRGRFAVQFPLPQLTPGFGPLFGSPDGGASPPSPPVGERGWYVAISVFWEPARLMPLPGTDLPDLVEVFQQGSVDVVPASGSPLASKPDWQGTLPWYGELTAATEGRSELWIVSQGSSP